MREERRVLAEAIACWRLRLPFSRELLAEAATALVARGADSPAVIDTSQTGGDGVYQYYILAVDHAGNVEDDKDPTYTTKVQTDTRSEFLFKLSGGWYEASGDASYDPSLDLAGDQKVGPDDILIRIGDE